MGESIAGTLKGCGRGGTSRDPRRARAPGLHRARHRAERGPRADRRRHGRRHVEDDPTTRAPREAWSALCSRNPEGTGGLPHRRLAPVHRCCASPPRDHRVAAVPARLRGVVVPCRNPRTTRSTARPPPRDRAGVPHVVHSLPDPAGRPWEGSGGTADGAGRPGPVRRVSRPRAALRGAGGADMIRRPVPLSVRPSLRGPPCTAPGPPPACRC
jgi:hypothetical protein